MAGSGALLPPRVELLSTRHDVGHFSCGVDDLDRWLRKYAAKNQTTGASQTHVAVEQAASTASVSIPILGYYCLSATSISRGDLPQELADSLPSRYPVPACILGRLAVQEKLRGGGLGTFLLFDAFKKVVDANLRIAVSVLIVDAMFDYLVPWYKKFGFQEIKNDPLRLFISVGTLAKAQ
jgi:hypothetical protein